MKAIHRKRLEKLATHLEKGKLGHKKFDFDILDSRDCDYNRCGTAGCAVGELHAAFPRHFVWREEGPRLKTSRTHGVYAGPFADARRFFRLNQDEHDHLFEPCRQNVEKFGGQYLDGSATRKQVAANIREFLKRKTGDTTNE